jgi:hypothetical protein
VLPQHKVEQKKNKKKETIMMIVRVKNAEEVCGRQVRTGKGRPAWLRAAADALISGRKSEKHYTNALIPSTQHWSMHARKGGKKRQTNKYLTESIHQQSSMRGWAKKKAQRKHQTDSIISKGAWGKKNKHNRQTDSDNCGAIGKQGNNKNPSPPAPPQNTTKDATTEEEGRVKSHLEKPEKKQNKTKQKGNI